MGTIMVIALAVTVLLSAQTPTPIANEHSVQKPFQSGGDIRLDLTSGDRVGDLSPGPFKAPAKGWLGHSIHWHGNGAYTLRARVGTGDLNIAAAKEPDKQTD